MILIQKNTKKNTVDIDLFINADAKKFLQYLDKEDLSIKLMMIGKIESLNGKINGPPQKQLIQAIMTLSINIALCNILIVI